MKTEEQVGKWWTHNLTKPVVAAAGVRLAILAFALARTGTSALFNGDTSSYLVSGRNLLLHGCFIDASGLPEIFRTPGYPLFLALFNLAGPVAAALAQVVLSVFSVILVWRLALAVFADDRTALVAAWIFAFEPLSTTYSVILLSDTLFLTLLLLSMERLVEFLQGRNQLVLAAAGLWLTAATFVRPVTYYLPVAIALGLVLVLARVPGLRWKAPAVLLISVLPWLAAWQIRNKVETGFSGFESVEAMNLYIYQAAEVTARIERRPFDMVQNEYVWHSMQGGLNQAQRAALMHSEAVMILRAHPEVFFKNYLEGSIQLTFTPGIADLLGLLAFPDHHESLASVHDVGPVHTGLRFIATYPRTAALMAIQEIVLLGMYLFAVRGVIRSGLRNASLCLLLGVSIYFLAVSGGAQVMGRYRLPIMPVVCIFAAAGLRRGRVIARA